MKHSERKLAIEAQNLCWSFLHKMQEQTNIATSGPTVETKMLEFRGDFPQLSNFKPEILISKAERMRYFDPLPEELAAMRAWQAVVEGFPPLIAKTASELILLYRGLCHRENPATKKRYTHADCAKHLKLGQSVYDEQLEALMMLLQIHYKRYKEQYLAAAKAKKSICSEIA